MSLRQRRRPLMAGSVAFALLGCTDCRLGGSDTPIASHACVLDASGVEFTLTQPLKRRFNSGSVLIELAESWTPEPPWTAIRLADGRLAKVSVSLSSDDGRVFSARILGAIVGATRGLNARFDPEVPKDASIRVVRISSTIPLHCLRVTWHDFDAL
jgi:hypothetical protein